MVIRILTENQKGLGLGHVARCYNLARIFVAMGYSVDLFIRGDSSFQTFIQKQGKIINKQAQCYPLALQWEEIINPLLLESDICIIDSYIIHDFTSFLHSSKVLVLFDDDGRHIAFLSEYLDKKKHNVNIATMQAEVFLLNPNGFYTTQNLNQHLRQHIFSGLQYALLHPCFHDTKLMDTMRCYDFFVCLGGEDADDKSATIFTQLQAFAKSIVVVVGANYKGSLLYSQYMCQEVNIVDSMQPYKIYHNISQEYMAELMALSKHCIVSGGGIIFEALKLCPKVFALNIATNQDIQIAMLVAQNLITTITLPLQQTYFMQIACHENGISHGENIVCNVEIGTQLYEFASQLAFKALNKTLQANQHKKAQNFSFHTYRAIDFCNLSSSEAMRVLTYRNHPFVRERMYGNNTISTQTHYNFLQSLHNDEHSRYFLVQDSIAMQTTSDTQTYDIGVISFSRINLKHRHAYLGIYKNPLLKPTKGKRYGHYLMQMIQHIAFCHYNLYMLYLEVVATNTSAIRFYEKEGFHMLGVLQNAFRIYEHNNETFHDVLLYGMQNPNMQHCLNT